MSFDALPVPTLTPAFDVTVELGTPELHGATSAGSRRVVPILGGTITGELEAELLAGGADRQLIRADGTIEVDAVYSARTDQGELLLLHAVGLRTGSPEVLARLGRGEEVGPHEYEFRTTVQIETSSPRLAPLQRSLFLASAERRAQTVIYRAHRLG